MIVKTYKVTILQSGLLVNVSTFNLQLEVSR